MMLQEMYKNFSLRTREKVHFFGLQICEHLFLRDFLVYCKSY
jgi:hypothetical protein